jgi:hypothetical protein
MTNENRLSDLLRDPGWSLPPWPQDQALARIRRAARRQRLVTAAVGAGSVMVLAGLVAAPFTLPRLASRPAPSPRPVLSTAVPAVGSAGFPVGIYPAPVGPRAAAGQVALCPSPAGLQAPGPGIRAAALSVVAGFGRGFRHDLRVTDRAAWPLLTASGRRLATVRTLRSATDLLSYSGPLRAGVGELAAVRSAVAADCGRRVMRATWVLVSGPARQPSPDAELLFLTRHGQVLLYDIQ